VLERDGHALQAGAAVAVEAVGLSQGGLAAGAQERVDAVVGRLDPIEVGGGELAAGDLARVEELDAALRRQAERVDHAVGGTRNPPSAGSGAFASTSSRGQDGRDSSGRTWFVRSSACAVGSTPDRSIVESWSVMRATSSSVRRNRASRATCSTSSDEIAIVGAG